MANALSLVSAPPSLEEARTAPHNIEAEQALLGALLVHNEAFERVSTLLKPEHFYEGLHRRIYEVATQLIASGKVATPITLKTFLGNEDLGGLTVTQYLVRLVESATTTVNAYEYARMVRDLAVRRELILVGEDIAQTAYDAPVDLEPKAQIEEAERRLFALAEAGGRDGGFMRFADALTIAIGMAEAAYSREGGLAGISTGLHDLDAKLGGLQRSDLVIIAGRPGMGKTALATNIAYNIARNYRAEVGLDGERRVLDGGIVGFFSLEMSAQQLATRVLAEQSGVPGYRILRGGKDFTEQDYLQVQAAARQMQSVPLHIDETGGISIGQLTARARRLKRQRGLDVLVVDYLQLLSGSARKGENRVQELTEITTGLKALAKELHVPVVALSQLSRAVESREDKRPQLSDLRESGSIEQDADVVMFVYREEYYVQNRKPDEANQELMLRWMSDMERVHGRAEVIIGKQRHGPTGTVPLQFDSNVTRFSDPAREDYLPERR
jgi:replicative DNA helicase